MSSTVSGALNNQPDQIATLVGHNSHPAAGGESHDASGALLYFCEDGGQDNGVHARDARGAFYTILDGYPAHRSETTGLAFSPDHKHMYVAFQGGDHEPGMLYDVYRLDGHPFGGATLDIKYHEADAP